MTARRMDDGGIPRVFDLLDCLDLCDLVFNCRMDVPSVATAMGSAPASRILMRCPNRSGSSAIFASCCFTLSVTLLADVMLTRARAVAMKFNFMTNVFGVRSTVCSGLGV